MRCANGHEVVFGLVDCQECGRRVGAANLPASHVRQTMPGDHASGKVDDGRVRPVDGPRRRRGSAWLRAVVALVLLGLIAGAVVLATRSTTQPRVATQKPGQDAQVGDCLTDLPHIENPSAPIKDQRIDHVTAIACSRPHMAEAFAQFNLYHQLGTGFPGYDAVERAATKDCQSAFAQQRPAGRLKVDAINWTSITPGYAGIYAVDPEVVCVAYRKDKALVPKILEPGHGVTS